MDFFTVKKHSRIEQSHNDIPDDTLYIIIEKLDKKSDQDSFGLTCHRFLDIQNSCRKRLRILPLSGRPIDNVIDYSFILDKLLNRFRQLQSISLSCCSHSLTDDDLNIVTGSCKSLKQLDLGWCSSITDIGIGYINRNCRQLIALRVSGCPKILGRTFQGFSRTLNHLEAQHCAFVPSGLASILSGGGLGFAANLKVLDFSGCNRAAEDAIIKISQGCPLLKDWNLHGCHSIGIRGWESIGLYQNLKILNVKYCRGFCDAALEALAKGCTRLFVLYMTNDGHRITPSGILYFKTQRPDVELYYC